MTTTVGSHELEEWEVTYLLAIHEYMANQGKDVATPLPPSVRDMVHLTGATSTSVVNYWIKRLAANGYVVDDMTFHGISRASTRLTHLGKLIASVLYDTYALSNSEEETMTDPMTLEEIQHENERLKAYLKFTLDCLYTLPGTFWDLLPADSDLDPEELDELLDEGSELSPILSTS